MDQTMPDPDPSRAAEPDASRSAAVDGSADAGDPVYDQQRRRITPYDPDLPAPPEHDGGGER